MVRKVGGFTFQELNLTIDDIKSGAERGADLSYDFVNRPAYHHAIATGDTEFLRLTLNLAVEHGVEPASLVHALQNHDEMTYELVHFETLHAARPVHLPRQGDQRSRAGGHRPPGPARASDRARRRRTTLTFTQNGIASTTATIIAASLGFTSITKLSDEQVEQIKQAHLLLAMFNALQPGVFALSGWDLVGALTLDRKQVSWLVDEGDTRWIHRSAYDLMDYRPRGAPSRCRRCRAGSASTGRCPPSCRTDRRSPAGSATSWPCASATASPPPSSWTCRRYPTRRCWSWCTSSATPSRSPC